ncbi:MAG: hypothetical protein ACFE68_07620 [Candidatus Hodarchaeota archaeon]
MKKNKRQITLNLFMVMVLLIPTLALFTFNSSITNVYANSIWGTNVNPGSSYEWSVISASGYENYSWIQPISPTSANITTGISITESDILNLTIKSLNTELEGILTIKASNNTILTVLNPITSFSIMDNFALNIGNFKLGIVIPPQWENLKNEAKSPGYGFPPVNYSEFSWQEFNITRKAIKFSFDYWSENKTYGHNVMMIFDKSTGVLLHGYSKFSVPGITQIELKITKDTLENLPKEENNNNIPWAIILATILIIIALLISSKIVKPPSQEG